MTYAVWSWLARMQGKNPRWSTIRRHAGYVTVGSSIAAAADITIQTAHDRRDMGDLNQKRVLQMAMCGAAINGMAVPAWVKYLQRAWGSKVLPKILCDQAMFAPTVGIAWIAAGALVDMEEVWPRVRNKLLGVWAFDACFWVPWNGAMFAYVPLPFQPYFAYMGNFIFVSFVTAFTHDG